MILPRPITIVGGGLAGLTLGLALRAENVPVPVRVLEAGHYPRHRVCGEFIQGRGLGVLRRLGLGELLLANGAREVRTAAFHSPWRAGAVRDLPEPALAMSRHALDALLAERFRVAGGILETGERVRIDPETEGTILATGRRPASTVEGWRWFGLKVHARGVRLRAGLEMHLSTRGYVGLVEVAGGVVNVCGLFRRPASGGDAAPSWREWLGGQPGSVLAKRLADATFDESTFTAVAGLDLRPVREFATAECRVGDALTMIPPFTGNGMSMAFESAELAAGPLAEWSLGAGNWSETRARIARTSAAAFHRRLRWAGWIQRGLFVGILQPSLVRVLTGSDRCWRLLFERTR